MALLAGCESFNMYPSMEFYREGLPGTARWAVLPFVNMTEAQGNITTPMERAMMVQLPGAGVLYPRLYPESQVTSASQPLAEAQRLQNARQWAASSGISFAVTGKVVEWVYDEEGRGSVAVELEVFDVRTNELLWAASGSGEGLPGEPLFEVSRQLFANMLTSLPINRQK